MEGATTGGRHPVSEEPKAASAVPAKPACYLCMKSKAVWSFPIAAMCESSERSPVVRAANRDRRARGDVHAVDEQRQALARMRHPRRPSRSPRGLPARSRRAPIIHFAHDRTTCCRLLARGHEFLHVIRRDAVGKKKNKLLAIGRGSPRYAERPWPFEDRDRARSRRDRSGNSAAWPFE
jgi:hypothetical protein